MGGKQAQKQTNQPSWVSSLHSNATCVSVLYDCVSLFLFISVCMIVYVCCGIGAN